jgi:hypothetical protein
MKTMTKHAEENLQNYARIIGIKQAKRIMPLMAQALDLTGSTAAVIYLDKAYSNPHRNDWKPNDVLAAIIRNGQVVTVMMTRKEQVNKKHFRTSRIIG